MGHLPAPFIERSPEILPLTAARAMAGIVPHGRGSPLEVQLKICQDLEDDGFFPKRITEVRIPA
jgi:hypothetical protein